MNTNCHYYHVFANGENSRDFITSEEDFIAAINRFAVSAANIDVKVLAFSIEESHPHVLLFGVFEECVRFKCLYESLSRRYIIAQRGGLKGVDFGFDILEIDEENYLMKTGGYIVSQATKDGKNIMPYDYYWGTGSMYFRGPRHINIWKVDAKGNIKEPVSFGKLTVRQKRKLLHSNLKIPDAWEVCNGIILPDNYIAREMFEDIYKTCNCYRVFLSSGRKKNEEIINRLAWQHGIALEDIEARLLCTETCKLLFGKETSRWLNTNQRIVLARELRKKYKMTFRQISDLTRIPEPGLRKWIK